MVIKVSAFHVYTHDLDTTKHVVENCASCDVLLENQKVVFDNVESLVVQHPPISVDLQTTNNYENTIVVVSSYLGSSLFCRPPPALN